MTSLSGHNHEPACCCQHHPEDLRPYDGKPFESATLHPLITCPQCPEHGELSSTGLCNCSHKAHLPWNAHDVDCPARAKTESL